MSVNWPLYDRRLTAHGKTPRERTRNYAIYNIDLLDNASVAYMPADVYLPNSTEPFKQDFVFLKSDDNANKYIIARHGEDIICGSLIVWANHKWIVTDLDVDDDLYAKGTITKSNYELSFVLPDGTEVTKPAYIRDVTKYLVGETRKDIITVGSSRMSVTVAKDNETTQIHRGTRFLIDDADANSTIAYEITKIDRVTGLLDGNGIYKFLVVETNVREGDDVVYMIPDNSVYQPNEDPEEGGWF